MARLLIIEDGVALASLLVSATSERGHLTSAYHAGSPGLQAASEERFDLAVVDLLLPDLRGAEVLEKLRALGVPTIAMSGVFKGERFARDAVERHGAQAFFEKPFALDRLLDAIDAEVLRARSQPSAPSGQHAAPDAEDDDAAIELDFDLEVDVPTAEIHLDHPTTELELNPEALAAFNEALEHSASGEEGRGPSGDVEAGPGAAAGAEDAETSFAGMLDDEPADSAPTDAGSEGAGEASPASEDEITAPTPIRADDGDGSEGRATDDEVTAPTPAVSAAEGRADAAQAHGDAPAMDASAVESPDADHDAGDAPVAQAADTEAEAEFILLQSDDIREDPDAEGSGGETSGREVPGGVEGPTDAPDASPDAQDAAAHAELSFAAIFDAEENRSIAADPGPSEIPPEVSEHIDHSLEQAIRPTTGGAPHTPFSERGAVWEGEPINPTSRARLTPPPEASLGKHGLYGLLNACHQSRFTGTLNVEGAGQRILTLVDGQLTSIRNPADPTPLPSIAELSVQEGLFDWEMLEEVRELAGHEDLSEDAAVVLMGLMTPEQLSTRLRDRLRPLLIEILGWTDGRLHLTAGAGEVERTSSGVPLAGLIFEAILERGGDEVIAAELPDELQLAPTEDPPYELGELPLSGAQAQLLAHSDGSKRVSDLALLSDLEVEEVRLTLWALVRLGILAPMTPTRSTRRITFGL